MRIIHFRMQLVLVSGILLAACISPLRAGSQIVACDKLAASGTPSTTEACVSIYMRKAEVTSVYLHDGHGSARLTDANHTASVGINEHTAVYILQADGTVQVAPSVAIIVGQRVDLLINGASGIQRSDPLQVTADEILIR